MPQLYTNMLAEKEGSHIYFGAPIITHAFYFEFPGCLHLASPLSFVLLDSVRDRGHPKSTKGLLKKL